MGEYDPMDLIRNPNETIPNDLLDLIFLISNKSYKELSNELSNEEDNILLSKALLILIKKIKEYENGYPSLLWAGILLGQYVMPSIKLHNVNNPIPDVIMNLVCGHCFTYLGVNEPYAKGKISFPRLIEEVRTVLFINENSLDYLSKSNDPTWYKNAVLFYYYLLGVCIKEDYEYEMSEMLKLCVLENVLSDEDITRQLILKWILESIIPKAWDRKCPDTGFDRENYWHSTFTKLI